MFRSISHPVLRRPAIALLLGAVAAMALFSGRGAAEAYAPPNVLTTSLPAAIATANYSQVLQSSVSPVTWALVNGELPAGLTLDPATGTISGTPTIGGNTNFTVRATDSLGHSATAALSMSTLAAPETSALTITSPSPAVPMGSVVTTPAYSTNGVAMVVFQGGTIDQLNTAITNSGANGAWAQAPDGSYQLYIAGAAGAPNGPFLAAFPVGFPAVTALTLVRG